MTVSMRVVYAGKGYRYLLRSVAVGDRERKMDDPLTRYYSEEGTPPGRWMGTGVSGFGDGQITPGSTVTEAQLVLLLGMGRDPITGEQLGRTFAKFTSLNDRIATRTANLSPDLTPQERDAEVARIEAEETERGSRHAVSGFDLTFSVPKSVSVLWGVADAGTQALIADAHRAAVAQVLGFIEREVAATRIGITAGDGPVAQVAVDGVAATAYDHWDSRAGDPQLHTHVVISVKTQAARDGRWRALDSRPIHAATVAVSELYNAVLADRLTGTFGLGWDTRDRGANRNPAWEVTGVGEDLIGEFSSRSREIDRATDEMIADYVARHGRRPSAETIVRMRAEATLTTRPEKHIQSLADLTADWRTRADRILYRDSTGWARVRQSAVRSASDWMCFSGRVVSVASARIRTIVSADGRRPWRAAYSAIIASTTWSISRERLENSPIRSSPTPVTSQAGLRLAPRSRASHSRPKVPVSRSARTAL